MSNCEKRIDNAKGIIQRARGHLSLLCKNPSSFRMSIPVKEDDSDIIIDRALNEGWKALQDVESLKSQLEKAEALLLDRHEMYSILGKTDEYFKEKEERNGRI